MSRKIDWDKVSGIIVKFKEPGLAQKEVAERFEKCWYAPTNTPGSGLLTLFQLFEGAWENRNCEAIALLLAGKSGTGVAEVVSTDRQK